MNLLALNLVERISSFIQNIFSINTNLGVTNKWKESYLLKEKKMKRRKQGKIIRKILIKLN